MSMGLKDPLFLAAFLVFLTGIGVMIWCLFQLRSSRPHFAAPKPAPAAAITAPVAAPAPAAPSASAAAMTALETRYQELARRVNQLESTPPPTAPAPAAAVNVEPLAKKLQELEDELNKLKLFMADAPAAPAGGGSDDLTAISQKVEALQKVMESLTAETEVAKPS